MAKNLIITPVKDSLITAKKTIQAVSRYMGENEYIVFNDNSGDETSDWLKNNEEVFGYTLIHAKDIGGKSSPNQRALLIELQKRCGERNIIFIESDVVVQPDTIFELEKAACELETPGLIGALTVDESNEVCFPYSSLKNRQGSTLIYPKSVSFCCTLLSNEFIRSFNFAQLSLKKDWFDVDLSKKARSNGYKNYILLKQKVLHIPHSSRPWKMEKYTNPCRYYIKKLLNRRDRV